MLEHKHLLLMSSVHKPPINEKMIESWMLNLIETLHMKPLIVPKAVYCEKEGNKGMTCICAIETSHIVLHSWDEKKPAKYLSAKGSGCRPYFSPFLDVKELKSGNIEGSKNLPFQLLINKDRTFKKLDELMKVFKKKEISNEKNIAFTCGSGITACILGLANSIITGKKPVIYDGSWAEYGLEKK